MAFTQTGERLLADCLTGVVSTPDTLYVGLCSAQNGTEITGDLYARVAIPKGSSSWNAASATTPSVASNKGELAFPASGAAWNGGTPISYAAIFTAASGGTPIAIFALDGPVTVLAAGQTVKFLASSLMISIT